MDKTYSIIETLCNEKGITINKLCTDIKIRNSILFDLKSGRTKKLSTKNLQKISNYFRVPMDYLLDLGEIDPADIPPEPKITDDQLMFALYGEVPPEITEEDIKDVREYAIWKLQQKRNKKDKEG